jgi:hypothetical protein
MLGRSRWAVVALALSLAHCSDSSSAPPVTVVVSATPESILPGQTVSALITVTPPENKAVDYVLIQTSGVLTSSESLDVRLAGTFTATRGFTAPLAAGTGTLTILATAHAGGGVGNGQALVAVADTTLPRITQFAVTPTDTVQFGDSLTITYSAFDNVGLQYSILRLSGALTRKDSINEQFAQSVQRSVRVRVPSTTTPGNISVTIEVKDVGGHLVTSAVQPIAALDSRAPIAFATVVNPRGSSGFAPGDSLRLNLSARDNARLQLVGYQFGPPANTRDSFPATDSTFSRTVGFLVPSAWTGTSTYTVFARDAVGNRRELLAGTFTVASRSRAAPWSAALGGAVRDMAYDVTRNRLYASLPDSNRVAVLSLPAQAFLTPLSITGEPRGLDLSLGGDSLLVARRTTSYVTVVNLVTGASDTLRVNNDDFLGRGADNVRVMGNNKALVTITFYGSGYGGSLVEVDLATRAYRNLATVTEFVPLCRSGDRSKALALIDDSCCPIDGLVYDALLGNFYAHKGTVSQYFNYGSADFSASRFLVTSTLFNTELTSLGSIAPVGATGPSVIAPDAQTAYFATSSGITRVRTSDGGIVESFNLGAAPYRLAIAPDGLTLFAAVPDRIFVVDTW